MKKTFSTHWNSSKQTRKQRKYLANAPLSLKRKFLGAALSKELKKKYGKNHIPVKTGDVVKIMRGKFKKKQGKILRVKTRDLKVYVEGIQLKKKDGSKVDIPMRASNLQIVELNLNGKKRMKNFSGESKEKETKTEKEGKMPVKKVNKKSNKTQGGKK